MKGKKILILANYDVGLYKFRKELLERLLAEKYKVYISLPNGEYIPKLVEMGCTFVDTAVDRRGTNPFRDFRLIIKYRKIIKSIKPDCILTYTIKPNIYGGIVAATKRIPYIPNVTGLGSAIENGGLLNKFVLTLYKFAFRKAKIVFFQNGVNQRFFEEKKIAEKKHKLIPGSGVNLQQYSPLEYPEEHNINFAFIARIMKDKGAEEFFEAAKDICARYDNVKFHICGFCEEAYESRLKKLQEDGVIEFHGMVADIRSVLKDMHCVVLPSYHEGLSNVLLEAAASGRPLISTNIPGCRECFEDGTGGYYVEVKNLVDLAAKMEQFIKLTAEEKKNMGMKARKYVEEHFDRQIVVEAYMNEINSLEDK